MMERFSRNKHWLTGVGFFLLGTITHFLAVDQSKHPSGWDGYYYVMQVHSLITYGHMQSPDFSLIYPFLTIITYIVGDPILGFKIGVAIIAGLLTTSVYCYLKKPWIACSYIIFSPLTTYFILQFPKNALGLVFFIFFMASLKKQHILTVVFFICTVLTHRMTGAFALLTIPMFVSWRWVVAGIATITALSFLPGIIHVSDLLRFEGQLTSVPHWSPLAFSNLFPTSLDWLFKADLILISIAIIFCVVLVIKNHQSLAVNDWVWFIILLISIFPFFSFNAGDIGHRVFMITPVAVIVLISLVANPPRIFIIIGFGLFITLSVLAFRSYKPLRFDAPNAVYETIVERLADRYNPREYPLVIVHKGLAEMIIYKTDFDALNWLPPDNENVLRISQYVLLSDFKKYLDDDELRYVKTIAYRYYTLPETCWQKFVKAAKNANDRPVLRRIFSGSNPMEARPYFISKGKKQ